MAEKLATVLVGELAASRAVLSVYLWVVSKAV